MLVVLDCFLYIMGHDVSLYALRSLLVQGSQDRDVFFFFTSLGDQNICLRHVWPHPPTDG